mmetsp:Transcript_258/g.493  ORF Transcript_258/g.493 Transcript_258/m.493 type:complete len:789 (+) Transcript_258:558-2924(+)
MPILTQAQMSRMSEEQIMAYMIKQSEAQAKLDEEKRKAKSEEVQGTGGQGTKSAMPFELGLVADVQMPSEITKISAPSHKLKTVYSSKERKIVKLEAKTRLDREFVLLIDQSNPYITRGIVEDYDEGKGDFVPPAVKEKAPKSTSTEVSSRVVQVSFNREYVDPDTDMFCEIIFLVDVSGSMAGQRMAQTQATLQVFLNSLPTNCVFNVVAFSSRYRSLFPKSKPYDDKSMAEAQRFVDDLRARGGTDIYRPLSEILNASPFQGYPRQVFLLTDGEVDNTAEIIKLSGQHSGSTRIFTFGIGRSASVVLCKGIARKTRGTCEMVRDSEQITDQVMRVITSALQPPLCETSVDWGKAITAKDSKLGVVQVPHKPPPVYPGRQFLYATNVQVGEWKGGEITIASKANQEEEKLTLELSPTKSRKGTLLHVLAARARIRELEDTRSTLSSVENREIEALALKYNLASSQTSFVAVLDSDQDPATEKRQQSTQQPFMAPPKPNAPQQQQQLSLSSAGFMRSSPAPPAGAPRIAMQSHVEGRLSAAKRSVELNMSKNLMSLLDRGENLDNIQAQSDDLGAEAMSSQAMYQKKKFGGGLFGAIGSMFGSSSSSNKRQKNKKKGKAKEAKRSMKICADGAAELPHPAEDELEDFASGESVCAPSRGGGMPKPKTVDEASKTLLKLQKSDGAWDMDAKTLSVLTFDGKLMGDAKEIAKAVSTALKAKLNIDGPSKDELRVAATILSIAFLMAKSTSKKSAYVLLAMKARKFVAARCSCKPKDVPAIEQAVWIAVQI